MDKEADFVFVSFEIQEDPSREVANKDTSMQAETPKEAQQNDVVVQEVVTHDNDKEQEQHQELFDIKNDELEEMHLSKLRECDAATLNEILRVEIEMLARAKAREEIVINTLKCRRQELNERRNHIDKDISSLKELKDDLVYQLDKERLNSKQLAQEMDNTGKLVEMLVENYNNLKQAFNDISGDSQRLEQEQNDLTDKYFVRNAELVGLHQAECSNISMIHKDWNVECLKYKKELDEERNAYNGLAEKETIIAGEVVNATKKYDDIKKCYSENQNVLADLRNEGQRLHEEILSIELEELEKQKKEKELYFKQVLLDKKNELSESIEKLKTLEEKQATTTTELESEINQKGELETIYANLDETCLTLTADKENLEKTIEKMLEESKHKTSTLQSSINNNNDKLKQLNADLDFIMKRKTELLQILQSEQKTNEELKMKLADINATTKDLNDKIDSVMPNFIQTKERYNLLLHDLAAAKTALSNEQEKFEMIEKDKELQLANLRELLKNKLMTLENLEQELKGANRKLQTVLAAYKQETQTISKKNQEGNRQTLENLNYELNNVKSALDKENKEIEPLKLHIEQKTQQCNKLDAALRPPVGILKSSGKNTSLKSVSWRVPSTSTIDSDPTINVVLSQNKDAAAASSSSTLLSFDYLLGKKKNKQKLDELDELLKTSSSDDDLETIPNKHKLGN